MTSENIEAGADRPEPVLQGGAPHDPYTVEHEKDELPNDEGLRPFGQGKASKRSELIQRLNTRVGWVAVAAVAATAGFVAYRASRVEEAPDPGPILSATQSSQDEVTVKPQEVEPASAAQAEQGASEVVAQAASAAPASSAPLSAASSASAAAVAASPGATAAVAGGATPQAEPSQPTQAEGEWVAQKQALEAELAHARRRIAELEAQNARMRRTAQAKAQAKAPADDFVSVTILSATEQGVLIAQGDGRTMVRPGGQLPGGATFLGVDTERRIMRTDQGDFQLN